MKIKQQKQIKAYLVREFGDEKGTKLFINQERKNTKRVRLFDDKREK